MFRVKIFGSNPAFRYHGAPFV